MTYLMRPKRSSLGENLRGSTCLVAISFLIHLDVEIVALHQELHESTHIKNTHVQLSPIPRFQFPIKSFTALTIPDVSREDVEHLYPVAFVTCREI